MTVAELLLNCLEQLNKKDFEKFKWFLTMQNLEGYKSIPPSYLEDVERTKTVSRMIENYTEDGAVTVAVTVLKKQQMNDLAQKLSNTHPEKLSAVSPTTSSSGTVPEASPAAAPPAAVAAPPAAVAAPPAAAPPAAVAAPPAAVATPPAAVATPPAGPSLVAQKGSVIFAPIISSSEPGTWNVTLIQNQ